MENYTLIVLIATLPFGLLSAEVAPKKPQSLSEKLMGVQDAARRMIEKNPTTRESAEKIKRSLSEIEQLEEKAGIPPLYKRLTEIQHKVCLKQRNDPTIKQLLGKIKKLRQTIESRTESEQSEIEELTQKIQDIGDETEQKRLQAKIAEIEKRIRRKTISETSEIKKLNQQIQTEMKPIIEESRPIISNLQKLYRAIEKNIAELDKLISDAVDEIENSLSEKGLIALEKLRKLANNTREKMRYESRCTSPQKTDRNWVDYLI